MKQYHDLLRTILTEGSWEENRTGIRTQSIPGAMLKFDLREGFPAITTKKLAFKAVVGELIGFLRGCTSAADFRALGCNVWDQNANENVPWLANPHRKGEDDLGRVYGAQWRDWTVQDGDSYHRRIAVDQIFKALHDVRHNPTSRRIIVNAWNPAELDQMALPPCHLLFQLIARQDGTLHMVMYQRSVDTFLGLPFNIASYALLLELFAAWSGRQPATLSMMLADVHIYENHLEQVHEQLAREPYQLPQLDLVTIDTRHDATLHELIGSLSSDGIQLVEYQCHPAIKAPMAV